MSVANLEEALGFWRRFLDVEPRWRTCSTAPTSGVTSAIRASGSLRRSSICPEGSYSSCSSTTSTARRGTPTALRIPGNVHLCLALADARALWGRAVEAGARPIVPAGPVDKDAGPNVGARAAYVRIHDGISLELFQPPPP
jgi:hypothetical protein